MANETTAPAARPAREVQVELNIRHYEMVFQESLKAARRIAGPEASLETAIMIAADIFNRHCQDAVEQQNAREKNEHMARMVQPFLGMMERRGLI